MNTEQPLVPLAGTPTLIDYLLSHYRKAVELKVGDLRREAEPKQAEGPAGGKKPRGKAGAKLKAERLAREQEAQERLRNAGPNLDGFIEFANAYMTQYPASNPLYLDRGIGVRLTNGDTVALGPPQRDYGMRDEGLHVTRPQSIPGLSGIVPGQSYAVMGR